MGAMGTFLPIVGVEGTYIYKIIDPALVILIHLHSSSLHRKHD